MRQVPLREGEPSRIDRRRVRNLFGALRRRWFPPPPGQEKEFLESVKDFVDTQKSLRTDTSLTT